MRHLETYLAILQGKGSGTGWDLAAEVQAGRFRQDLYYRINAFPICLPPLRQRQDDIPLLAAALLERVAPDRKLRIAADTLAATCTEAGVRLCLINVPAGDLMQGGPGLAAVPGREAAFA